MDLSLFRYESKKRSHTLKVCEDELTSRVFGILSLIDGKVISKWLDIDGMKNIKFWPKCEDFEPDICITDNKEKIIIECKKDDLGSTDQIKKEYAYAVKKCNGRFIFITATVTRPELLEKSEKLLNLEDGTIEWRNWTSLYFVIEKILEEPVNIDETSIKFLVELRGYLEWLRMGYDLGNLMEKYKEIYKEGWLEILGEKFDDFVRELRRDFANQLDEATVLKKYENISVSSDAKRDLFDASWINFSSKEIEKVNDRLYYYLLFDMSSFQWYVVLGGTKKQIREQFREIILEEKTHGFLETSENTGSDWIVGCPIVKKPDFSNPTVLKKELVEKTLHSIITMDDYIKNKISN